jgi:uncharacterized protein
MRILTLSDIHGHINHIPAIATDIAQADVVIISGDLTNFGDAKDGLKVLDAVRQHNPNVLAVTGNCDPPPVREALEQAGVSIEGTHRVIDGLAFAGQGGSLPCPIPTAHELSDEDLCLMLEEACNGLDPGVPLVLVAHQPPLNTTCDLAAIGTHVGSAAVREFIESRQPVVCFTGHIHEAMSIDYIGKTAVVNSGPLAVKSYSIADWTNGRASVKLATFE